MWIFLRASESQNFALSGCSTFLSLYMSAIKNPMKKRCQQEVFIQSLINILLGNAILNIFYLNRINNLSILTYEVYIMQDDIRTKFLLVCSINIMKSTDIRFTCIKPYEEWLQQACIYTNKQRKNLFMHIVQYIAQFKFLLLVIKYLKIRILFGVQNKSILCCVFFNICD